MQFWLAFPGPLVTTLLMSIDGSKDHYPSEAKAVRFCKLFDCLLFDTGAWRYLQKWIGSFVIFMYVLPVGFIVRLPTYTGYTWTLCEQQATCLSVNPPASGLLNSPIRSPSV